MESVLAHAMPTPTIESSSRRGFEITATESSPAAPARRQMAWVPLRPRFWASGGRKKAKPKQTAE